MGKPAQPAPPDAVRLSALSDRWITSGKAAADRKDEAGVTVALLAHGMICAAWKGKFLSAAMAPDPELRRP